MYITVKNEANESFEEKKSEFIGWVKPVTTEDEAKQFVNEIKNKHREATHNVYAYIIGENMGIQRYSDDGEPQGTAGIPVLDVIKKNNITDVAVVVTRYFGGILLGAGGLCRAYTKGAALAIKKAGVVEKVVAINTKITMDYEMLGKVQYLFSQNNWYIESIEYGEKVELFTVCESHDLELRNNEIINCTNNKIQFDKVYEGLYFKEENGFSKI
jgi:uncharacterized YigZ family protein